VLQQRAGTPPPPPSALHARLLRARVRCSPPTCCAGRLKRVEGQLIYWGVSNTQAGGLQSMRGLDNLEVTPHAMCSCMHGLHAAPSAAGITWGGPAAGCLAAGASLAADGDANWSITARCRVWVACLWPMRRV